VIDEKKFCEVQEYLKAELERIQNGTARFCTLEDLDFELNEIIDNNEKQNLEDNQKHFYNKALNRSLTKSR
jgi:hypothetical protein